MNDRIDDLVAAHRDDVHPAPAHLKQQWHDAIDSAAAMERGKAQSPAVPWHPASIFLGMAIAAALALGIGIGYFVADEGASDYAPDAQVADAPVHSGALPASLSRGVQLHFRDSREQLLSLPASADRTLLVLQIIEQNRLFESAAKNSNSPRLARVLRALEPVLLQLAAEDLEPADAEALLSQLAFELNVMLTKLSAESSDDSLTT
ncbi:MAG: hypothetical protein WBM57_12045 [Woeseiaceae bacterium]